MTQTFANGYALLIGVGTTNYLPWSLPVTVNDVQAIRGVLTDSALCGFPDDDEHIRVLHDQTATRRAILDGLNWLRTQSETDPDAMVFIVYSGHGWLNEDNGRYFLIPHDVVPHDIDGSALGSQEFTEELGKIKPRRMLVMIDACHAEGLAASKALKLPAGLAQSAPTKALMANLKKGEGRAVFTSSRGSQKSWVRSDNSLSIFTHHVLEALQGAGNSPGDIEVRLSNLMGHLGKAVPASAQEMYDAEQVPFFDTATEDFPVALLRAGKGLPDGGWEEVTSGAERVIHQIVNVNANGERSVAINDMSGGIVFTGDHGRVRRKEM